jgi:hypothetical protein
MSKPRASILRSTEPGFVWLVTPYNKTFVDHLKADIPYPHRKWSDEKKQWLISESFLEELVGIMTQYYEVDSNLSDPNESSNLWIDVFRNIRDEDCDRVFKSLAFALHPDRGGSPDQMKALNEAYSLRTQK